MTLPELQAVVDKVRFCGLWQETTVEVRRSDFIEAIEVRFSARVPDRDSGFRVGLYFVDTWGADFLHILERLTERDVVRMLHMSWRRFAQHEADEDFIYDGKRPFDPHAPAKTVTQAVETKSLVAEVPGGQTE